MKLHDNTELFNDLIELTSDYFKIDPAFIEKDYFVTLILSHLNEKIPEMVFKGGTSLSKCYNIINRFSEDIDITLNDKFQTQRYKRLMKLSIISVCSKLGLEIINFSDIKSRKDYNCYNIKYPYFYHSNSIKPFLFIETTYITKPYPVEEKLVSSFIYEYLKQNNYVETIEKYKLSTFNIKVQAIERTFIDKVFAICDYSIENKIEKNSRHIYDIAKMISKITFDDKFSKLIISVRNERKKNRMCPSAQDGVDVSKILNNIIKNEIYKKDYERTTNAMMFDNITYEEAIKTIAKLAESKLF